MTQLARLENGGDGTGGDQHKTEPDGGDEPVPRVAVSDRHREYER
jgi:hypothetical protein